MLSPELALVDPELAERARSALPPSPVRDAPTRPARVVEVDSASSRGESRGRTVALVAAASVALVLGVGRDAGSSPRAVAVTPPQESSAKAPADVTPGVLAGLQERVRRSPRSVLAREQLGTAYLRLRRWVDAERQLRALVALAPDDDYAHFALGHALAGLGRKKEAAREFRLAESLARG